VLNLGVCLNQQAELTTRGVLLKPQLGGCWFGFADPLQGRRRDPWVPFNP
jgi:hypothetical protein